MSLTEALVSEFDQEMSTTRKLLERVPSEQFGWKPHEKSMGFGQLAGHVATLPGWVAATLGQDELDLSGPYTPPKPNSNEELLEIFDKNVSEARANLSSFAGDYARPWTLRVGDRIIFTMPKAAVLRAFVLNHIIHHRGQLSVYLRLNGIPVPSIYGPTADESL